MIPSKLRLENFFSHKDSEIDFSKFNSALLIGNTEGNYNKSNGSGKSAIFEAILWCLFNKSRAAMMDDIIRWGETTCSVSLEFKHDGESYLVERFRNRANSTSTVEFSMLDKSGEWQDISCSTSGDTNDKIESTIKLDNKTFINSVYFRQNDISEFAESDPSRKKEILKSIVDISRWDDYEKAARKKVRDINIECKVLKKSVEEYDSVVEKLQTTNIEIKESKKKANELSSKKKVLFEQIDSLSKKYTVIKKSLDTDTYDKVIDQIKILKQECKEFSDKSSSAAESVEKYKVDKKEIDKKINTLKKKIKNRKAIEIPDGKIEDLRAQLTHYKSQKASSEEALKSLGEINVSSDECYVCNQTIDNKLFRKLEGDHNFKVKHYKFQSGEANKEVRSLEKEIDKWLAIRKDNNELKEIDTNIGSLTYKLDLVVVGLEDANKSLEKVNSSLDKAKFKIKTNMDILESIKNEDFQSLRLKLGQLRGEKDSVVEDVSEEDKKMGRLTERASLLKEQESKMRSDKNKVAKKMERSALFDKLAKIFGKGGIQTILLDAVIEDLEKSANTILASICNEPVIIVLETQRLGADGTSIIETLDLKVRKDGHLQNFKSLSGGEKFRISLALRVALSDISSRYGGSSLEFLLLDEVNSPLDRFGVETLFVNVIKSLEDKYKILVITHDESLKEKFDNVVNITKINGESELEFITR
jgi:DNA repair exonuclease SbcCD ATPase subunit